MRIVSRDRWFETRHFYNGISLIHEPYVRPFYRCNMWHVQGRERDVLVDSGSGLVSLREQLPWLTERPLLAVASHTHFDHIAGHHEFAERLAHPAEAEILAAPDGDNTWRAPMSATRCSRRIRSARCATPNTGCEQRRRPD